MMLIEKVLPEQIETIRTRMVLPRTCVQLPGCRQPAECQVACRQLVTKSLITASSKDVRLSVCQIPFTQTNCLN